MADLGAAVQFELSKIRTLRSTFWNLGLYLVVSLALALATGYYVESTFDALSADLQAKLDPVATGFGGLRIGLIALVVFGVIIVSSEFSSGTIRSSLTAVPRRGVLYGAKLLGGALVASVSSIIVVLASFFVTQAMLGSSLAVSPADDGVLRSLIGAVVYTTLLCLFAMGLAAMLRSSALTIGILFPLFFIVSTILTNIPGVREVAQFLPDVAGGQILSREPQGDTILNAWTGTAVLVVWTTAAVVGGYLAVRRRDV